MFTFLLVTFQIDKKNVLKTTNANIYVMVA